MYLWFYWMLLSDNAGSDYNPVPDRQQMINKFAQVK